MNAIKNLVPFPLVVADGHPLLDFKACSLDGFLPVNPRRDESGQVATDVLAHLAHLVESLYASFGFTAYLRADVPSLETLMLPVCVPDLLDNVFIGFQLIAHVPRVPIFATIV